MNFVFVKENCLRDRERECEKYVRCKWTKKKRFKKNYNDGWRFAHEMTSDFNQMAEHHPSSVRVSNKKKKEQKSKPHNWRHSNVEKAKARLKLQN